MTSLTKMGSSSSITQRYYLYANKQIIINGEDSAFFLIKVIQSIS